MYMKEVAELVRQSNRHAQVLRSTCIGWPSVYGAHLCVDGPQASSEAFMGQVSSVLRRAEGGYMHWCPACHESHILPDSWHFDGNLETPTFSPSFKHECTGRIFKEGKWTGEWHRTETGDTVRVLCHYILTEGILNYCGDCTHAMAGQSVPLPPLPPGLCD